MVGDTTAWGTVLKWHSIRKAETNPVTEHLSSGSPVHAGREQFWMAFLCVCTRPQGRHVSKSLAKVTSCLVSKNCFSVPRFTFRRKMKLFLENYAKGEADSRVLSYSSVATVCSFISALNSTAALSLNLYRGRPSAGPDTQLGINAHFHYKGIQCLREDLSGKRFGGVCVMKPFFL